MEHQTWCASVLADRSDRRRFDFAAQQSGRHPRQSVDHHLPVVAGAAHRAGPGDPVRRIDRLARRDQRAVGAGAGGRHSVDLDRAAADSRLELRQRQSANDQHLAAAQRRGVGPRRTFVWRRHQQGLRLERFQQSDRRPAAHVQHAELQREHVERSRDDRVCRRGRCPCRWSFHRSRKKRGTLA